MDKLVAIDIGGTFTDIVIYDGKIKIRKIFTGNNPETLVDSLIKEFLDFKILHATTLATNAILTRQGLPRVAKITTKGFKDVIEIGRQNRPKLYDLFFEKPRPLVEEEMRFEVNERIDSRGKILAHLDHNELNEVLKRIKSKEVQVIAVCLLNSYVNPEHERTIASEARKSFEYVSASYEVANEPREYERTSTTVINALLMPILSKYLARFKQVYVMSSAGGLVDKHEAIQRPVQLIESGPAAGVIASAELARILGIKNVISLDMGGTTAKASSILDNTISITSEYEVAGEVHHGRIIKGSGYPLRFPFIDLAEVSTGGGSIIWKDKEEALRVGPISAGSYPGPACYRLGGQNPTITDANLLLGRISDEISGYKLDKAASIKVLSKLGDPYRISRDALSIANLELARAIRLVTIERGYDPIDFHLFAFGGAGPQHACFVGEEIGIRKIVIPPMPGLFSSFGLLLCDEKYELRGRPKDNLEESFEELEKELEHKLGKVDYFERYADMKYKRQGWEIIVKIPSPCSEKEAYELFEEIHMKNYGFKLEEKIEIVTIRVFAVIKKRLKVEDLIEYSIAGHEVKKRLVYLDDLQEIPVYPRAFPMGTEIEGPAIIEEYSSSTFIPKNWKARIIELGCILLER